MPLALAPSRLRQHRGLGSAACAQPGPVIGQLLPVVPGLLGPKPQSSQTHGMVMVLPNLRLGYEMSRGSDLLWQIFAGFCKAGGIQDFTLPSQPSTSFPALPWGGRPQNSSLQEGSDTSSLPQLDPMQSLYILGLNQVVLWPHTTNKTSHEGSCFSLQALL